MKIHCSENELTSKAWEGESSCPRATLQWQARARSCWYISPLMLFSGSPSCICANGVRVDVRISMGRILVPKTRRGLPWRRLFLDRRSVVAACPGSTVRTTACVKVDSYMTFDYAFFNITLSAADALPPDLIALRYYWCCRCPRREVWWHVRIEMIYVIHRSWSVRRIYKYVVNLRQLWVCYNERQLAVRYYSIVATRNSQLCTRKNHSCSRSV